jgi:hypothetical protein
MRFVSVLIVECCAGVMSLEEFFSLSGCVL